MRHSHFLKPTGQGAGRKLPAHRRRQARNPFPHLREHWYQVYVKDHARELGFERLDGPQDVGADFVGTMGGRPVSIEVEKDYVSYLDHHHPMFDVLVVGVLDDPPPDMLEYLPKTIIRVDPQQVLEYTKPLRTVYREQKERERETLPSVKDLQGMGATIRGFGESQESLLTGMLGHVEMVKVKEGWAVLAEEKPCEACDGVMIEVPYDPETDGEVSEGQEVDYMAGFWKVFECQTCHVRRQVMSTVD